MQNIKGFIFALSKQTKASRQLYKQVNIFQK